MAYDAEHWKPAKVDPLTITEPRERLKYLADFLRELDAARFDMSWWVSLDGKPCDQPAGAAVHQCGTTACIGGWAEALFAPRSRRQLSGDYVALTLGLTDDQSWDLFFDSGNLDFGAVTPTQAAQVIDHLLATGKVDWGVAT